MPRLPGFSCFLACCWAVWGAMFGGLAACTAPPVAAAPQWAPDSATVRLAAGPQYARGPVWRFFWGTHYRDLWATPVTAPVLHLAVAKHDSLLPMQAGGSYQSHTLRLRTGAGHQFVLRSVDKDMSAALPAGWRRNLLSGLMKDQTSVSQPYGAYVAAQLAEAVGVYHSNPRLVYLPNEPKLGKFRASYANALYLLEERPEGDEHTRANFGGSTAITNTRRLLTTLRRQPSAQAEPRAYLRARLLDMWLGDWSRREDQWRWASFRRAGRTTFRPIPRDRDQAFFLFDDGVLTRIISWFVPKFQSFHSEIRLANVEGLTRTARALDRTLLSTLSAEDFRQEADSVQRRASNAVIAQALKAGPAETRETVAARLGPLLRARRAQLAAVARRYYELLAAEAWVVGTDCAERFEVSGAGPGRLRVRMLAIRPQQPDSLLTERIYNEQDTKQINLYGLAGNDVFDIAATAETSIGLTIFDGEGHDRVQVTPASGGLPSRGRIIWRYGPDYDAAIPPKGIEVQADPHPELTANALGWLRRYNLRD